jgi:outer membrane protein TolC
MKERLRLKFLHPLCLLASAAVFGAPPPQPGQPAIQTPLILDLAGALERARAWNPQLLAAQLATLSAKEDRVQAKALMLPTVSAVSALLYTQGNGTDTGVFVANNGVHIYDEQGLVHAEPYSPTKWADYARLKAAEVATRAREDIARRGLQATVIQNYYGVIQARRHLANATQSLRDARDFEDLSQKQERGGEVARADVVKATLARKQRERDLNEAGANVDKAKLALAVLIFQDIVQPFDVVDDLKPDAPAPGTDESRQASLATNPDIKAAEASLTQSTLGVRVAKTEFLPTFSIDYAYGINSSVIAIHDPNGNLNIGSFLTASVTVPVWNWGSTRSKVRQAEVAQRQARNDLMFAQRQLDSNLAQFNVELQAARTQLLQLSEARDLAEENLRLTRLRYTEGEAVALEVVDSQSTANDARNSYDDGLTRYRLALSNLEVLMGRYQ